MSLDGWRGFIDRRAPGGGCVEEYFDSISEEELSRLILDDSSEPFTALVLTTNDDGFFAPPSVTVQGTSHGRCSVHLVVPNAGEAGKASFDARDRSWTEPVEGAVDLVDGEETIPRPVGLAALLHFVHTGELLEGIEWEAWYNPLAVLPGMDEYEVIVKHTEVEDAVETSDASKLGAAGEE